MWTKYNIDGYVGVNGWENVWNKELEQECGGVVMSVGEPFSTIKFKKEKSLIAFYFVNMKVMCGYSDMDDFDVYLNGESIKIEKMPDMFVSSINLIREDNIIKIEIKNPESFNYFKNIVVTPRVDPL